MRVVIAPDKFKGACTAMEAANAIAEGIRSALPQAKITTCPLADGGEGTVATMVAATGGTLHRERVYGPLPDMLVEAEYGILGDGKTAVIEMSAASGLALIPAERRNPMHTTTFGTGELIREAAGRGVSRIILGIGGSATTDGGIGALQALGAHIEMVDGSKKAQPLVGADLAHIARIEPPKQALPELLIACDVENPLYGPDGAAAVFGPQKGAGRAEVSKLDQWLRQLAILTGASELAQRAGSGAAGGLGFGLCAMLSNARMAPGFSLIAEAADFCNQLAGAKLCITAEGRFDRSSLKGKTAYGVARMCHQMQIPCIILAGSVEAEAERELEMMRAIAMPIVDGPLSLEEAMQKTSTLLQRAAHRIGRILT